MEENMGAKDGSMDSTHKHSETFFEIKIEGELDRSWETLFKGFTVTVGQSGGQASFTTTLVGSVVDQAALRGLLCKLWDLNLTLISIRRL